MFVLYFSHDPDHDSKLVPLGQQCHQSENTELFNLQDFPNEILLKILEHLSVEAIHGRVALVSINCKYSVLSSYPKEAKQLLNGCWIV